MYGINLPSVSCAEDAAHGKTVANGGRHLATIGQTGVYAMLFAYSLLVYSVTMCSSTTKDFHT